ncbi:hypothetical protein BDB01DRAFT_837739 [Pilobolus umbonatus]|nr:hypothetical protein BDB01DRAFT_837739 [Pilobolus umbonatus]
MKDLPLEIIEFISVYVDSQDIHKCISVCKSWSIVYIRLLYKNIRIKSIYHLEKFYVSIIKRRRGIQVGNHTEVLDISILSHKDPPLLMERFHKIMLCLPHLQSLIMPNSQLYFDYILNIGMPKMTQLSKIMTPNFCNISAASIMKCYLKFRSSLTTVACVIKRPPYVYSPEKTIQLLKTFSYLTNLSMKVQIIPGRGICLLEDIIRHCLNLEHLSYTTKYHDPLIHYKFPDTSYVSLKSLVIRTPILYQEDIRYIKRTFPNMKHLELTIDRCILNEIDIIDGLMNLLQVQSMEIKAKFREDLACKVALVNFWKYANRLIHQGPQRVKGKMTIHQKHTKFDKIHLSYTRGDDTYLISMYSEIYTDITSDVLSDTYEKYFGEYLHTLKITNVKSDVSISLDSINSLCPVLTEITLESVCLEAGQVMNRNLTRLYLDYYRINRRLPNLLKFDSTGVRAFQLSNSKFNELYHSVTQYKNGIEAAKTTRLLDICTLRREEKALEKTKINTIMHAFSHLEAIRMPNIEAYFDYFLEPEFPIMQSLKRLSIPNKNFIWYAKVMRCYSKFRNTLVHVRTVIEEPTHLFTSPESTFQSLTTFPRLTDLNLNIKFVTGDEANFFEKIIYHFTHLVVFRFRTEGPEHFTLNTYSEYRHTSLQVLELKARSSYLEGIEYITTTFPHLNKLTVECKQMTENQAEVVEKLMAMQLLLLKIKTGPSGVGISKKMLDRFWKHVVDCGRKKMKYEHSKYSKDVLSLAVYRHPSARIFSMNARFKTDECSLNILKEHLCLIGHNLNEIYIKGNWFDNDIFRPDIINIYCSSLLKLTLSKLNIKCFEGDVVISNNPIVLIAVNCTFSSFIFEEFKVHFPKLQINVNGVDVF